MDWFDRSKKGGSELYAVSYSIIHLAKDLNVMDCYKFVCCTITNINELVLWCSLIAYFVSEHELVFLSIFCDHAFYDFSILVPSDR